MGLFLTLISAFFYFFSFPPYSNGYSTFIALTPFILSLSKTKSTKNAAFLGGLWGVVFSMMLSVPLYTALVTEYEFSILFSTLLIIVSVYIPYGIIYGIFGFSYRYFFNKAGIYTPLAAASIWVLIDYTMSVTPIFMPWCFAGYSQTFSIFLQMSDITGIYGVTFLLVIINSFLACIFSYKKKHLKVLILILFLLTILPVIYGIIRINNINQIVKLSDAKKINASVIQGNFSSKDKWDSKNTATIINTYIAMSKQVIDKTNIIVWPETVLNSNDKDNLNIISGISSLLKPGQLFISGATRNDSRNKVFNSIFTSDEKGLQYIYDKKILFPFTETSFAGMSSGNFMDSPSIFDSGKTKSVYKSDMANIGYSICFESIYPDHVRKIKNSGASILINVANDSWFGTTYEPYMHMYSSVARGVENRMYVIRSSNSGISAIISPNGEILSSIGLNNRDKITSTIDLAKINSFYSKRGDLIIIVCIIILILFLLYPVKNSVKN